MPKKWAVIAVLWVIFDQFEKLGVPGLMQHGLPPLRD